MLGVLRGSCIGVVSGAWWCYGEVVYGLFLVLGGAAGKLYMGCFWCLVVLWGSCIGVVSGAWWCCGEVV